MAADSRVEIDEDRDEGERELPCTSLNATRNRLKNS